MTTKLAFISGATSGLGRELCFLLAEKGIPLFLTARNSESLNALKKTLEKKAPVLTLAADLSVPSELKTVLEAIKTHSPDLVINSAGIGFYGEILSYPLEDQLGILKLNVQALSAITIEAARALQSKNLKGTILNVSSAAANYTYPGFALYAASKRFVKEFSLSFDLEVSKYGIRILTTLPGRFASPFLQKASSQKEYTGKKSWDIMSLEKTAALILKQIEKQKKCLIIDFRYRILAFFSFFIPRVLLTKILKKNSTTKEI